MTTHTDNYFVKVDYFVKESGDKIHEDSAIIIVNETQSIKEEIEKSFPKDDRTELKINTIQKL